MNDNFDDTTHCPVCFEAYEESGKHIPRILPCFNTLCESCIKTLLKNTNFLICPVERDPHAAPKGEVTFPQNKYIVTHLRKNKKEDGQEISLVRAKFQICKTHERDMSMFCKEKGCQAPICSLCLLQSHKTHQIEDIVEVQAQESDKLSAKIKILSGDLQSYKNKMEILKKDMEDKYSECKTRIDEAKEEMEKLYEALYTEAEDHRNKQLREMDEKIASVSERLVILDSVKENTDKHTQYTEINSRRQKVEDVTGSLLGNMTYKYVQFNNKKIGKEEMKYVCGSLEEKEYLGTRVNAKVLKTFDLPSKCYQLLVVGDWIITIGDLRRLSCYDTKDGSELRCQWLSKYPTGITDVMLDGKTCIALSYSDEQKIDFYDVNSFKEVLSHSVAPSKPGALCRGKSDVLLFGELHEYKVVRWLDCSKLPLKAYQLMPKTKIEMLWSPGICYVDDGDKQLIVAVDKSGQIHAYNSTTGKLEWVVENKGLECGRFSTKRHIRLTTTSGMEKAMAPEAVTADDRGHLFICDSRNSCVQVFTTDGVYLGAILKEREKEFHLQMKARWSTATSSLVICHSPDVCHGPWKLSLVSICTA